MTVVVDHHPFEVTTLRHDIETDGRRAKVQFTDDWDQVAFDPAGPTEPLEHFEPLVREVFAKPKYR